MTTLAEKYKEKFDSVLTPLARKLELHLLDCFRDVEHIDRICARPKSVDRFLAKASTLTNTGEPKYSEPLTQIQDQIGARIIAFYESDVMSACGYVERYFRPIESKHLVPESRWQFGYFGMHYVLITPQDVIDSAFDKDLVPDFFELQIKTLFQHAWSEANHDLGYKPGTISLTPDAKRSLAFASAQAWGADRIFQELFEKREVANLTQMKTAPGS